MVDERSRSLRGGQSCGQSRVSGSMMVRLESVKSGMHGKGSDKGFVCYKDSFIWLTTVGASKGFENVDMG